MEVRDSTRAVKQSVGRGSGEECLCEEPRVTACIVRRMFTFCSIGAERSATDSAPRVPQLSFSVQQEQNAHTQEGATPSTCVSIDGRLNTLSFDATHRKSDILRGHSMATCRTSAVLGCHTLFGIMHTSTCTHQPTSTPESVQSTSGMDTTGAVYTTCVNKTHR